MFDDINEAAAKLTEALQSLKPSYQGVVDAQEILGRKQDELKKAKKRSYNYAYWLGTMVSKSWIERGDILSAHTTLTLGVEYLIDYLFLKNREFVPHKKWKFFFVKKLRKLPPDFSKNLNKALLVKSYSKKDVLRRIKAFSNLLRP